MSRPPSPTGEPLEITSRAARVQFPVTITTSSAANALSASAPLADPDVLSVHPDPGDCRRRVSPGAAVEHHAHSLRRQRVRTALVVQDVRGD